MINTNLAWKMEPPAKLNQSTIKISNLSKYNDDNWDLSEYETNPNVKKSASILRFNFDMKNNSIFSEAIYDDLRTTFKELIYAMSAAPVGKSPSVATLKARYTDTRFFIYWLIEHNIFSLSAFNIIDANKYILEVQNLEVHPMTTIGRLDVLKHLWSYRKHITNPLTFDALSGKSTKSLSRFTHQKLKDNRYDFIPDELANKLIRSCVAHIRTYGTDVAIINAIREQSVLDLIKNGSSTTNSSRTKKKAIEGTGYTNSEITTLLRQCLTCCYVIIGFFTGIRASEILSMTPDRIAKENGITYIYGKQHKISKEDKRWMAPDIVFEAHLLATSLTEPLRLSIELELESINDPEVLKELTSLKEQLFLTRSNKRDHGYQFVSTQQVNNIAGSIHTSIKELVKLFNLKDDNDTLWRLHPHQFRKTFVRFMCANSMNIRYLQEHMGHKSLDMTAWYDVDDIEMTESISNQLQEYKVQKLDAIFNHDQLITGAGSESIKSEKREIFTGLITDVSKQKFLMNLADDLTLSSTGHSWCMGGTGNGHCTGVVGCMADVNMVSVCPSALVTEEQIPDWIRIKLKNEALLESNEIGNPQKIAISNVLNRTVYPILKALNVESGVANG